MSKTEDPTSLRRGSAISEMFQNTYQELSPSKDKKTKTRRYGHSETNPCPARNLGMKTHTARKATKMAGATKQPEENQSVWSAFHLNPDGMYESALSKHKLPFRRIVTAHLHWTRLTG
ncbi:hypothetical protein HYALB_00006266 [Hymenoscyphus albidus]|uniref:Uncharacterized protein n=1 Tax=Hymenoscyphus albidus TaxID=595503 RepID=A0A9N9M1M7_9HELO|nr:hypothetical protein HYALB_00006266 [Hymenoscyphus albidus]